MAKKTDLIHSLPVGETNVFSFLYKSFSTAIEFEQFLNLFNILNLLFKHLKQGKNATKIVFKWTSKRKTQIALFSFLRFIWLFPVQFHLWGKKHTHKKEDYMKFLFFFFFLFLVSIGVWHINRYFENLRFYNNLRIIFYKIHSDYILKHKENYSPRKSIAVFVSHLAHPPLLHPFLVSGALYLFLWKLSLLTFCYLFFS